jgi:putative transport protein
MIITCSVSVGVFIVIRHFFRSGRTRLAGMMAGAHTQPAVLAFANGRTGYDSRVAQGYALVYPAALVAKILIAKVLGAL